MHTKHTRAQPVLNPKGVTICFIGFQHVGSPSTKRSSTSLKIKLFPSERMLKVTFASGAV